MILFSAEAIIASSTSKFGIWIPLVDDEDIKSSTESTISTSLIQCIASEKMWTNTYLSFKSYLPTSKCCWCREFVKVKFRDLQSLLVCPIILWESSLTRVEWISGWRSWLASRIQNCVWIFTFTHHMWWCVFWYIRDPRIWFLRIRCWRRRRWICKKRFPTYHACPKYLAALLCGSAFLQNGLAFPQDLGQVGKTLVDW